MKNSWSGSLRIDVWIELPGGAEKNAKSAN